MSQGAETTSRSAYRVNLNKILLGKGARLHDRFPQRLSNTSTDLRLHSLELKTSEMNESGDDLVATHLGLLKVAAMQRDPKHLAKMEKSLKEPYGWGIAQLGSRTCMMRPKYEEWRVQMALTLSMA